MYSVNLLGQNGDVFAGQDFDDKETAVRFYCNPRKYFAKSEFEGDVTHISIEGPDENASRSLVSK